MIKKTKNYNKYVKSKMKSIDINLWNTKIIKKIKLVIETIKKLLRCRFYK